MSRTILALDIGEQKIGVARADTVARIAEPLVTLSNDEFFESHLSKIINDKEVGLLVIGLPRGLDGQDTKQTKYVRRFCQKMKIKIAVHFQDEALTSVKAKERLTKQGKSYTKMDVDAQAASIILEDYLMEFGLNEQSATSS